MEKLMTIKEVAEYLQLEEHTIYKMARKGEIPAFKIAGQWRFSFGKFF
jgi:excisionase family DNA binding protein